MDEAYLKKQLSTKLTAKGFFVINHSDKSRTGIPDLSASKNHKTLWIEVKYLKYAKIPSVLNLRTAQNIKLNSQMMTMVRLEQSALAYYFIFINDSQHVLATYPTAIKNVLEKDVQCEELQYVTLEEAVELVHNHFILGGGI